MLSESDSDNEVLYEYAEELAEIQKESATVAEQQIEMTTLFLRFRGEIKQGDKWETVADWSREDTLTIPSKLLNDIFEFINWERNGWPEEGK